MNLGDVIKSKDSWTPGKDYSFRIWEGKFFWKEESPAFYGGYQIRYVYMGNERGMKVVLELLDKN